MSHNIINLVLMISRYSTCVRISKIAKKVHVLNIWTGILFIVEKLRYNLFIHKKLLQELVRQDATCLGSGLVHLDKSRCP